MKTGKTLSELAQELERIQETKRDFIVPTAALAMNSNAELEFKNGNQETFAINDWSAGQIAGFTDIPKAYFDRLRMESPELLSKNVNHGLTKQKDTKRLLRTLDGKVRGFMSDRYRILDAHDLLEVALPVLIENQFDILSSEVTERRLYVKAATPKISGEVKKNDIVNYGVMLSTSDVGAGSLRVEPFFYRLVCLNGMVMETKFRKAHLGGGRSAEEQNIQELLSNETKRLNDAAFFATVRDYLTATMKPEIFQRELLKFQEAAAQPITNMDLEKVVELSMNATGVRGEGIKKGILHALATGNDGAGLTKWGLANSFTRAAHDEGLDYDTATDLERAGGTIIELPKQDWKRIAEVN